MESTDSRTDVFALLSEVQSRLSRVLDAELRRSAGIPLQTYDVMVQLAKAPTGRLTMSELADAVALTTGGVTRVADRLTAEGLVRREACPDDRRVIRLALTSAGVEVLRTATGPHRESLERHIFAQIDPEDLPALRRALQAMLPVRSAGAGR
jgi:DNA-binding MarR family transcriptional regulator